MGVKREKPEDIGLKLRWVEVLQGQGKALADTVGHIPDCVFCRKFRWRHGSPCYAMLSCQKSQIIFERLILFYRHPFAHLKSAHRIDVFTPNYSASFFHYPNQKLVVVLLNFYYFRVLFFACCCNCSQRRGTKPRQVSSVKSYLRSYFELISRDRVSA